MADPISIVVVPMISLIMEKAYSLISEEFLSVCGVKKDVERLSSSLTTIQDVLQDAEDKQLNDRPLKNWLGKLKEAAYDAEDILDIFATEAYLWKKKSKVQKFQPLSLSDASHKIKEISERLDMYAEEKNKFHLVVKVDNGKPADTLDRPHTSFFVDKSGVVGREADKDKIIKLLLSDESDKAANISVIPIIGMGGLGKTTLAQLVFNDESVIRHFEFRMWVCVTVDFDVKRILKEMIEYHSKMEYGINLSPSQLHSRLLEFLARKRFLLVLDDVWIESYEEWESLEALLREGGRGSKVLVTSRTTKVSDVMGTQPPYLLDYLPKDQCWSLFEKIAFKNGNLSSEVRKELEDIGRDIVVKCKGLPLAVKAMGGLLRGNVDVNHWGRILKDEIWELEENSRINKPKILPALKLSYDNLPSYLKQCFTYCSIFPKAYVFDKEELVKLWVAESFIQSRGLTRKQEIGIEYFDHLLVRSFFQLANIENKEKYRMHDLIHDLAHSISSPECCQVKDNEHISVKSRHVSIICKDVKPHALKIVDDSEKLKLRTLLFPSEYLKDFGQALEKMFHSLRYIRVLDLSSSTLFEVPSSIEELKLLRYLDLSKTEIKELPNSICKLCNLQTLKLLGCLWLFELPKDLGNLVNLQHLELDDMFWFMTSMLPPRMGKLTNLHNLHAFHVGHETGYGIGELKDLVYLTGTLHISKLENAVNAGEAKLKEKESLQQVVFEWSDRDADPQEERAQERVLEDLQPHLKLKALKICHHWGARFPPWMTNGLLKNLVTVSLNHCTKCKILSLGNLPHLRVLSIKRMLELEEWQVVQFPSLCRLNITKCPKLRELPDDPNLFLNLGVLKIKKCESLKALPVTPFLRFLVLVDNPSLDDWREKILQRHFVNDQGQHVVEHRPSLFNLLELKIRSCPELQKLPQYFSPQKLEISGCELLSALPVPGQAQRLQHLALEACQDGALVRAIPSTNSLYSLVISNILNLVSLPKWPHLPGLKALYISNCKDLASLSEEEEGSLRSLTSLTLLSVRDCPNLVKLSEEELPNALEYLTISSCPSLQSLGPKEILKSLTSLKDLYIEECPMLQSLPEDGLPTSLQHLHIQGCPLLREKCQEDGGGPEWPKIKHIPDLEIDFTKVSPPPKLAKHWYHCFICSKGIEISDNVQSQLPISQGLMGRQRGLKLKGKMPLPPTESSSSS